MAFSKAQQEAILHTDGPALVLAGPGSGKTTVITYRIRQLISSGIDDGSHILVITFTKAAALEMEARYLQLQTSPKKTVTFGTFHSVFFRILRLAYGYRPSDILSESDRYAMMTELIRRMELDPEDEKEFASSVLEEISSVKSNHISPEHYYSQTCSEEVFRRIFLEYGRMLARTKKLDFDDILLQTLELLENRPDILAAWRERFRYILIDEFQDINYVQYQVIRLLAAPRSNLFIVGDDDQSVYRFRGARPEIMLGFEKDYPDAKRILLDINFRSDACIVKAAGYLIAHNKTRFPKDIIPAREGKNPVRFLTCSDIAEQNRRMIDRILELHAQGMPFSGMAILFRTNFGARFLTDALMKYNIPFLLRDAIPNLYQHWICIDILTYLKIADGDRTRALWLRIINRPNRYVQREALGAFREITIDSLLSYYQKKDWMLDRLNRLEYDLSMLKRMAPYPAIHYLRNAMHYEEYLVSYAKERRMNQTELIEVLDSIQESAKPYRTLAEWMTAIERYTESLKEKKSFPGEEDAVVISTLHASKGLEYSAVFIPDLNEDNIPHAKAVLDPDMEEERRLFYVGMTRAKDQLFLYCLKECMSRPQTASRFLYEMGPARQEKQ